MKPYWIIFMADEYGTRQHCFGHNAVADFRDLSGYLGYAVVTVNMKDLKK